MRVRNGVDIVAVERIEKSMKRPGFMARCFSPEEQEYICRKACPAETAAALWAAKEAFGKAMGVGLSGWAMPEAAVGLLGMVVVKMGWPMERPARRILP